MCDAYPNQTNLTHDALGEARHLILEAVAALPGLEQNVSALDAPTLLANQPSVVEAVTKLRRDMTRADALLMGAAVEEPNNEWEYHP